MDQSRLDRPAYIYILIDPLTNAIRYIGATVNPMARYNAHRNPNMGGSDRKRKWIQQIRRQGLAPRLVIVETTSLAYLRETEQWWMRFGQRQGWDLLNSRKASYGIKDPQYQSSPIKEA